MIVVGPCIDRGAIPDRLRCSLCGVRSLDVFRGETDRLVCGDCCDDADLGMEDRPGGQPEAAPSERTPSSPRALPASPSVATQHRSVPCPRT